MSTSLATLRIKPRLEHLTRAQLLDLAAEQAGATAAGKRLARSFFFRKGRHYRRNVAQAHNPPAHGAGPG